MATPDIPHQKPAFERTLAALEAIHQRVDRLLDRRSWIPLSVLLAWSISIVFSVPGFTVASPQLQEKWVRFFTPFVKMKVTDPLADMTVPFDIHSNQAKRTYRITAPAFAYVTRTGVVGAFLFNHVCGYVAMHCAVTLAASLARRRAAGFYMALLLAATYIGTSSFKDIFGYFDSTTFAFLLMAATVRRPGFCAAALVAALFSDERALALAPLVAFTHAVLPAGDDGANPKPRTWAVAVAAAMSIYILVRATLTLSIGLGAKALPIEFDVVAANMSAARLRAALWSPLEGGWLIVACAGWLALRSGRRLWYAVYAAYFLLYVFACFFVLDVTRSLGLGFLFIFPMLPFLRAGLGRRLESLLLIAGVVSLFSPNVFVWHYVDYETSLWSHLRHAVSGPR
jgi:hypothetical protein